MKEHVLWVLAIGVASAILFFALQREEEAAEVLAQAKGRYEVIDSFPMEDGDYTNSRILKNRNTGDCLLYLGHMRGRTITSIACPEDK